jgi:hypothetical protein
MLSDTFRITHHSILHPLKPDVSIFPVWAEVCEGHSIVQDIIILVSAKALLSMYGRWYRRHTSMLEQFQCHLHRLPILQTVFACLEKLGLEVLNVPMPISHSSHSEVVHKLTNTGITYSHTLLECALEVSHWTTGLQDWHMLPVHH